MKKRALIVAAPEAVPGRPLNGTVFDLLRWQNFLLSPRGGAWHPHRELSLVFDPTGKTLRRHLAWVGEADLAYVVFSGHGYTDRRLDALDALRLMAGPDLEIGLKQLLPLRAKWSVTVVDACRSLVPRLAPRYGSEVGGLDGLGRRPVYASAERHRQMFDRVVQGTTPHHELVLSTAMGSSAEEIVGRGGLFTSELLGCASDWVPQHPGTNAVYRTLRSCVDEVRPVVLAQSDYQQVPRWVTSDSRATSLPFSIAVPQHRRVNVPSSRAWR